MAVPPTGKRVALNMKASEELRRHLEAAARVSGRSLTAEVEARVRQSFEREEAFMDMRACLFALAYQQRASIEWLERQKGLGGGFPKSSPLTAKLSKIIHQVDARDAERKLIVAVLDAHEAELKLIRALLDVRQAAPEREGAEPERERA
jgi:hypothetical protein